MALLPTDADDTNSAPDRGCVWRILDHESCYVWFDRSGEQASDDNASWALDSAVYEWSLRTGLLEPKGYNWIIAEFAVAARPGLRQRIVWPQTPDPEWDGTVTIRGETTSDGFEVPLLDALKAREDPIRSGYWWRRRQYLPGAQEVESHPCNA